MAKPDVMRRKQEALDARREAEQNAVAQADIERNRAEQLRLPRILLCRDGAYATLRWLKDKLLSGHTQEVGFPWRQIGELEVVALADVEDSFDMGRNEQRQMVKKKWVALLL